MMSANSRHAESDVAGLALAALDRASEEIATALDIALEQRADLARHTERSARNADTRTLLDDRIGRLQQVRTALRAARALLPTGAELPLAQTATLKPSGSPRSHTFDALEEERQRLLRELHDGPAQVVSNVGLRLDYVGKLIERNPSQAHDELRNLQEDIKRATGEMRHFMYELVPPGLAQGDLRAAIQGHCERIQNRFALPISVAFDADPPLTRTQQIVVFRVVQEAIQNVIKHAEATAVTLTALIEGGVLIVQVHDDGRGLENLEERLLTGQHLGMASMRARARQVGATVDFTGGTGEGTMVTLRLPLES